MKRYLILITLITLVFTVSACTDSKQESIEIGELESVAGAEKGDPVLASLSIQFKREVSKEQAIALVNSHDVEVLDENFFSVTAHKGLFEFLSDSKIQELNAHPSIERVHHDEFGHVEERERIKAEWEKRGINNKMTVAFLRIIFKPEVLEDQARHVLDSFNLPGKEAKFSDNILRDLIIQVDSRSATTIASLFETMQEVSYVSFLNPESDPEMIEESDFNRVEPAV